MDNDEKIEYIYKKMILLEPVLVDFNKIKVIVLGNGAVGLCEEVRNLKKNWKKVTIIISSVVSIIISVASIAVRIFN